jgi:hypothetical protein
MARTPTERLLQQQIQTRFPRLSRHWRRALARWVLGARLAGSANRPALAHALATAGIARAATLADAWDAWIAAPAHRIDTADPPAAGAAGDPSAGVRRRPAPRDSRALDRRTAGAWTGCRPSARCHRSVAHERPLSGRRPAGRHPPEPPARGLFITHKSNRHVDPEEHAAGATTSPHYHPTGANHARSFAPPARHRRCGPESPPTVRSSGLPAAESAGLAGDAASGGSCRTGPAMRGALRPPSTPPPHPDALRRSATPTAVRRHNRRPAHAATVRRFPGAPVRSDSRFSLRNDSAQSATGYGASARPGARRPRLSRPAWSPPPAGAR